MRSVFVLSAALATFHATNAFVPSLRRRYVHTRREATRMPSNDDEIPPLTDRLAALPELPIKDEMLTALSADGFVSAKAVVSSTLVRELATRQMCLPLAAAALGRSVI